MRWPGRLLVCLLFPLYFCSMASAQSGTSGPQPRQIPQRELDQLLAPVALYPDVLLSQVLMAATFPSELADAARWSRDNPSLLGETAVAAAMSRPWDASVKSLAAFPPLLVTMDRMSDWTARLGQAFLAREASVIDTIQHLRQKAYALGQLNSGAQLRLERRGGNIVIESASPALVFVPCYNPAVIYGDWWWPGHAPAQWQPGPGCGDRTEASQLAWSPGVPMARSLVYGGFDWQERRAHIVGIRLQPTIRVAVSRDDSRGVAIHVPQGELQAVSMKPAPLVNLGGEIRAPIAPARPDSSAAKPDSAAVRPAPLVGLGKLQPRELPRQSAAPQPAKPEASGGEQGGTLITLMPSALQPAARPPQKQEAVEPVEAIAVEAPAVSTPAVNAAAVSAADGVSPATAALPQRVFRAFTSAADRRTLDSLKP